MIIDIILKVWRRLFKHWRITLISALAIALLFAWQKDRANQRELGRQEVHALWDKANKEAEAKAREQEQLWETRVHNAQNQYQEAINEISTRNRNLTSAIERLRNQASRPSTLPTATAETCRSYAAAVGELFSESASRYSELAGETDRCAAAFEALDAGWSDE